MDWSDIVIVLSRHRSGANALGAILESHPDVFRLGEVFSLATRNAEDEVARETNFFNFLNRYARGDMHRILVDRHEKVFLDFLEYLRCFSAKRYLLIDVKYDTTHFLAPPSAAQGSLSYFFDLATAHGLRVLNVTRRNYLRYVVSMQKALASGRYTVGAAEPDYADTPVRLDITSVLTELNRCNAEDRLVRARLEGYPRYFSADYNELFPSAAWASTSMLDNIATWLDLSKAFDASSRFKKMSSLPLSHAIENFDDTVSSLSGTEFEYCLHDEHAYDERVIFPSVGDAV